MSQNKVILISVDGMRPDGLQQCGNPYLEQLKKIASYTFDAKTVFPSITLPCHMSLFHSVTPERHGTTNNDYTKPVRPFNGLFEQLNVSGKRCTMYYGWEPLRDVARPGSLVAAEYINAYSFEHTDAILTDRALEYIKKDKPDFVFLYLVETDEKGGHDVGWMSETYLQYISDAVDNIKRVIEETAGEYTVIVTADHGGHDRCHGTEMPEDMTIPMVFYGPMFEAGRALSGVSILDIAPTVAGILGVQRVREWEGRSLLAN
ncbi:MAG: alkaline phosphatase family protein [Clostridia bacterium]|nr:alkaline phosphatase family protein [Clostridia bacterium]